MRLVYIHEIGENHKDEYLYEFIFSDNINIENTEGDNWDIFPANSKPSPPYDEYITEVGLLKSKLKLEVVQKSKQFGMSDAIDGVIALAWEDIEGYETYPKERLNFKFGDDKKSVERSIYNRGEYLKFDNYEKTF
jgi:hypothetical protein